MSSENAPTFYELIKWCRMGLLTGVDETGRMLYELKVELQEIESPIWRIIQVPSRTSLLRLYRILQPAMRWTNSHLHFFEVNGKRYGEPSTDWDIEVLDSRNMTRGRGLTGY